MEPTSTSLEYRGRRIVSQCTRTSDAEHPHFGAMRVDIEGVSWVEDAAGRRITPDVECRYSTHVSGSDYDAAERWHKGWILLGDFILLTDHQRLSLWVADATGEREQCASETKPLEYGGVWAVTSDTHESMPAAEPLDSTLPSLAAALSRAIRLCALGDFMNFYGDAVSAVRFMDSEGDLSPEGIERRAGSVMCGSPPFTGPLDAIGGAARVFVDGLGWRWLFPHDAGPAAALAVLKSTRVADDLARLQSMLAMATDHERRLAEAHFRVASRGIAPDSMYHCHRGLDVAEAMRLPVRFPEVAATLEQVFAKPPAEALNLEITAVRRLPSDATNGGRDAWKEQPVPLAEAVAGVDPGKDGYRVTVTNKATTTLAGIGSIPHVTVLDASGLEHLEDLGDLARCTSLRDVNLSLWGKDDKLKDITPLSGLLALQELNVTGRKALCDLTPLGGLGSLERLCLRNCTGVRSVEPLRSIRTLRQLDLLGSMVESLEPLVDLPVLAELTPTSYALTSLKGAPVVWLKSLTDLHLSGACGLKDFSELHRAVQLKSLSIAFGDDHSPVKGIAIRNEDLAVLATLPALTKLELRAATPVTRLDGLSGMGLESLHFGVWGGSLAELEAIGTLTHLRDLRLTVDAGLSLMPLRTLTRLEKLEIEGDIDSLEGIENCTALKELWLRKTPRLTGLKPIARLEGLEKLYIESSDGIASLTPLAMCTGLRSLSMANQHCVADLTPLTGLAHLEELSLGSSPFIASLLPLAGLSRLKNFSFGHMPALRSLEGIPAAWLSTVEQLDLDLPLLEQLEELRGAIRLKSVFISKLGCISLAPLGDLPALENVYFYSAKHVRNLDGLLPGKAIREVTLDLSNMPELQTLVALADLPCLRNLTTSGMQARLDAASLPGSDMLAASLGDNWTRHEF
jgi:Leucine-rich repeat (LRR) protein